MEQRSERPPIANASGGSRPLMGSGPVSPLTLGLVTCGGVGALLFTVIYLVEEATRPRYGWLQQPISALSLGPGGWAQQVSFVIFGVLLTLSAVGWRRLLAPGSASIWFPIIQGLSGLCLIALGFFSTDPLPGYPPGAISTSPTAHGTIHTDVAVAFIVLLGCGCFVLSRRLHTDSAPRRSGWAVYSGATGFLILFFFALFLTMFSGGLGGLYERVSALSHALWSCLLVVAILVNYRGGRDATKRRA